MQGKLLTAWPSLTEGHLAEGLLPGDEGGQPDHARLVAENVAAVAGRTDGAPGSLGEVGRGQHEEGQLLVVLTETGVSLDMRGSPGPPTPLSRPSAQMILQPRLLAGCRPERTIISHLSPCLSSPGVREATSALETVV